MRDKTKQKNRRERSIFIEVVIRHEFALTLKKEDLDSIVTRAINEGIGDWGIITKATRVKAQGRQRAKRGQRAQGRQRAPVYSVPFEVVDIETNKTHTVTRGKLLRGIRDTLIDFPYALDTLAGYNLNVGKLTMEDIDEIIQQAIFKELHYGFD